jgi:hypothetical protein
VLRILVALAVLTGIARADDDATHPSYRVVVDRVDLEPASITGLRLRVYLSALSLQGQLLPLDANSIKLFLGPTEKKAPFSLGTYDGTGGETAIVFVVEGTIEYTDALPMIADAIDHDLLGALNDHTQVALLTYGEAPGTGKLAAIKGLRGKVSLSGDSSAGDPALLDTIDRALLLLKRAKTAPEGKPLRKLIVVIGDGRDRSGDKDRVTRAGQRAAKEGVRIHALAFSPADIRRPLLALGELSKKSFGTFRWVRAATPDSWKAAIDQLRDEIEKQYVLTYFLDTADEAAGRKLHVTTVGRIEATSNEIKVPEATCGGSACDSGYCGNDTCLQYRAASGGGILHWILLIGGIVVGSLVLLGFIGWIMSKRSPRIPMPGGVAAPGAAPPNPAPIMAMPTMPTAPPPGLLPNGRPIPALMIMSGPRAGQRQFLRNGFLIGKQPGCDLLIEDGYTSSQHAQVSMDAVGNCQLFDRGSTNGTFVNGSRITQMPLQHGAQIRIGSTELIFLAQ